jgi:PAS domain S-box-containing protein
MKYKYSKLKINIFQKLLIGITLMLILNVIIAYVGIVNINTLENASEIILKESNKYKNLQTLKLNFTELLMPANDYLIHGNNVEIKNFEKLDSIAKQQFEICKNFENTHFNEHFLEEIEAIFHEVESLSEKIFELKEPIGNSNGALIMEVMDNYIKDIGGKIDILLLSSSTLMDEYINSKQVTNTNASRIIIIALLFIMISLLVGGFYYVKEITNPIKNLALIAENVAQGNFNSKAEINKRTHDEIDNFANLFNNMIEVLSETTVSKDYLNSVIQKINEILIITDVDGKILIVNKATLNTLEYNEDELIGASIEKILLGENKTERTTLIEESVENIYNTYYSKSKSPIPVTFTKSFIYNVKNKKTGILYLAIHDKDERDKGQGVKVMADETSKNIDLVGKIPLTIRELEIIKLIVSDYSNQQIADKLFISIRTVETHRKHIMEKLHTKSIIALVKYAIQNGLA